MHGFDEFLGNFYHLNAEEEPENDPFERADHEGIGYTRWRIDRTFVLVPAQAYVGQWLQTFREFPPRQKPGSFSLGDAMDKIIQGSGGRN